MCIELHEETDGVVAIDLDEKLCGADYDRVTGRLEEIIDERGKIRVLCNMHNFHGWTPQALWKDAKFTFRHRKDVDRVAIVGENRWQHALGFTAKWFTPAEVAYFDHTREDDARVWVRGT